MAGIGQFGLLKLSGSSLISPVCSRWPSMWPPIRDLPLRWAPDHSILYVRGRLNGMTDHPTHFRLATWSESRQPPPRFKVKADSWYTCTSAWKMERITGANPSLTGGGTRPPKFSLGWHQLHFPQDEWSHMGHVPLFPTLDLPFGSKFALL